PENLRSVFRPGVRQPVIVGQYALTGPIRCDEDEALIGLPRDPIVARRPRWARVGDAVGSKDDGCVAAADANFGQGPAPVRPLGVGNPLPIRRPGGRALITLVRCWHERDRRAACGLRNPYPKRPDRFARVALIGDPPAVG